MDISDMKPKAEAVAMLLKTISHPERLMVLCQLMEGEVGVSQLQENSSLSQSAFSQHLLVLKKHDLVATRKAAQQVFYSLKEPKIASLIMHLHATFCAEDE